VKDLTALSIVTFVLLLTGLIHELTELLYIQRNKMFECCLVRIHLSLFRSCLIVCRCLRSGVIEQDLHFSVNVIDQTKILSGPDRQAPPGQSCHFPLTGNPPSRYPLMYMAARPVIPVPAIVLLD